MAEYKLTREVSTFPIKQRKRKIMGNKIWTRDSARAILGDMVIWGAKVIFLNGKGTKTLCSAADFLVKTHGFTIR